MTNTWQAVRRFLTAEEVPRWFGLSLVLIYLVGLGTVARVGISLARRDAAESFGESSRYAVTLLADRIAFDGEALESEAARLSAFRRALREITSALPTRSARIIRGQRVIASTRSGEVGKRVEDGLVGDWRRGECEITLIAGVDDGAPDRRVRVPVVSTSSTAFSSPVAGGDGTSALTYLDVVFPADPTASAGLADQAGTLAVVLIVLGALFVTYRCLREQLRGARRIASRLTLHRDRIEDELGSLHISDAADGATVGWNQLVALTQQLLEAVQRSDANEELSRALQQSSGGIVTDALNALPDGIAYINDDLRFEYANPAACRLLGWRAEDVRGLKLDEAESQGVGAKILALIGEARQPDGSFAACTELATPDEGSADVSAYRVITVPLQRTRRDNACVVVIRDVSQQLRAERAREEFVTHVTHELRTPLTNIRAYAETLSAGMFDDPKAITDCYNVITKETRRLSRLIEDILSVSQLEVGAIELCVDDVDLKVLLDEGLRDVRSLADEKNIDVQLVLPPKVEPIRGDRDKLAVVVNNLLGNAIKYTPNDGNVIVGFQLSGDNVVITIKDNGIGIDPSEHARIFEKFQRGSNPEVSEQTGTGIGLYTAREITRRHGGEIEVISEKGQGSTFLVRLPRRESRAGVMSTTEGVAHG